MTLTTRHIVAIDAMHRVGGRRVVVAHADTGAVSLINIVDVEVGEESVGFHGLSSCHR